MHPFRGLMTAEDFRQQTQDALQRRLEFPYPDAPIPVYTCQAVQVGMIHSGSPTPSAVTADESMSQEAGLGPHELPAMSPRPSDEPSQADSDPHPRFPLRRVTGSGTLMMRNKN